MTFRLFRSGNAARALLERHFGAAVVDQLVVAARTFPSTARVDLQLALDRQFGERYPTTPRGVFSEFVQDLGLTHLAGHSPYPILVGPLQYDEIDVGEAMAARCLKRGLWLARAPETAFAVMASPAERFGHCEGLRLEIAVPPGDAGASFSRAFLEEMERLIYQAGSYRGKVLSLEAGAGYTGKGGSIKVHRLHRVSREEVILPEATLRLLERNVHRFLQQRERLHGLGLAVKKGLLFYGPPGTGKTHTIHYLASQLPDHTTLLITAEQVGLLDEYFQLARFLQPAMVVIEDVDLIARAREEMRSAGEESLLNKLLNEMDGLREDAAPALRADHQSPRPAGGGTGRTSGPYRPGHRVPAAGRRRAPPAGPPLRARLEGARRGRAGHRGQDGEGEPRLHQGADAALGPVSAGGRWGRRPDRRPRGGRPGRDALRGRQPEPEAPGRGRGVG